MLQSELQDAWSLAQQKLHKRKMENKKSYDKKLNVQTFSVGDLVLLKNEVKKGKYDHVWLGPFIVEEVPSEAYMVVSKDGKRRKIHCDKAKHYKSQNPTNEAQRAINFIRNWGN